MNMQEEELRLLLESHGWNLFTRERTGPRRNAIYLLARQKRTPYRQVYLTSRRQLPITDREEVLQKIGAAS